MNSLQEEKDPTTSSASVVPNLTAFIRPSRLELKRENDQHLLFSAERDFESLN
jgi:hypothetical protein